MHRCLPLLKNRRKLVFLRFSNVDPQELRLGFPFLTSYTTLMQNKMHDLNKSDKDMTNQRWSTRYGS
jgi:hypothetical protein